MLPDVVISLWSIGITFTSGLPWSREHLDAVRAVDLDIHKGETVGLVGGVGLWQDDFGAIVSGHAKAFSRQGAY